MKKTTRFVFTILICWLLITLPASAQVRPAAYSNASLKGSYGMLTNTWLSNQSDTPCVALSIANFDGAGNFTVATYQNCAGTVNRYTGSGTYSVAKDGTGSMNVTLSGTGSATEAIILESAGRSFQFVQTSCTYCGNTDVNAGTAVAMGASSFSNATLKGNYEFMMTKWTNAQDFGAGVALGVMAFDGAGTVKVSWTDVYDGTVNSFTFTGTYSVDSWGDCLIADQNGLGVFVSVVNSASSTGLGAKGLQLVSYTMYSGTATKH